MAESTRRTRAGTSPPRQRLTRQLRDQIHDLEQRTRDLESFTHRVTHDLKAPLRSIVGFSQILEDDYGDQLDDEGRRVLGIVRKNARRMGQMMDDLLALTRVGREPLSIGDVDVGPLARAVCDEIVARAGERTIDVQIRALPRLRADRDQLRTVLHHLVSNAVKFTGQRPQARIEIGQRTETTEPEIFVRDNGAGFDMAYAEKLFEPFERLHYPDEFPGNGLGLAIVARIIERHHGRLWAEAVPGEGATFYVAIPHDADDRP